MATEPTRAAGTTDHRAAANRASGQYDGSWMAHRTDGTTTDSAPRPPLILVAEDHPDSRDALRSLLEVYGYRVATAVDGEQAVAKALAEQPDLVVMDIMMPRMDGFEATRALRAAPGFRQVPILALTAMEGAREQVLAAGCDEYLPKPIDVRTFLDRIRYWLESRRPAGA